MLIGAIENTKCLFKKVLSHLMGFVKLFKQIYIVYLSHQQFLVQCYLSNTLTDTHTYIS